MVNKRSGIEIEIVQCLDGMWSYMPADASIDITEGEFPTFQIAIGCALRDPSIPKDANFSVVRIDP